MMTMEAQITDVYEELMAGAAKVAIIGLGYVGLPLAVALSGAVRVIGYDLDAGKIERYRRGIDETGEIGDDALTGCSVEFTSDAERLREAKVFIISVPTPITGGRMPDLSHLASASRMVARALSRGALVVYESTVYPGVTEEVCIPLLEEGSGLKCGEDFKVGYSPERINPGDMEHRLDTIVKIVSGVDTETVDLLARIYGLVVKAGVHRAESIRVAEAAKVVENAQRDLNIAFMNELAMLFREMNIPTRAVLEAAGTKWNFLRFTPGLVGGHCIAVDPYYLTYRAEVAGIPSRLLSASRQINEGMSEYVAGQIVKRLIREGCDPGRAKIAILGMAYKENAADIRNSKAADIVRELQAYGIAPLVSDPLVDPRQAYDAYGIELVPFDRIRDVNAIVLAVPHRHFALLGVEAYDRMFAADKPRFFFDVKGVFRPEVFEMSGYSYWSL
jgi:nucleotide sugar dehydrogenase